MSTTVCGGAVVAGRVRGRPALALAQLVERGVGCDAVRPRREGGATVEAREPANDRDHRLLGGIVGVATRPHDAPADRVDAVVVAAQQRLDGAPVAGLGGGDERAVVGGLGGAHRGDRSQPVGVNASSPSTP